MGLTASQHCQCFGNYRRLVLRRKQKNLAPIVKLHAGTIVGELQQNKVVHFSGIPFAAPPIGQRRWLRPVAPIPWDGLLDCTSGRPQGVRRAWPMQEPSEEMKGNGVSEDCLYLDVWAPSEPGSQSMACLQPKAPVLVWIYGGGLLGGSKDYDDSEGNAYAERGIVFVRANYRCGVLGFLRPNGGDANCGVWDQVEALRWVQREIGAFGGDHNRVTIMGQSAGADMVYFLVCSPTANKLFHRAIMQSPASFAITQEQGRELAEEFADVAGAKSSNLDDMQLLSAEHVLNRQRFGHFRTHPTTGPGWRVLMSCRGELLELPMPDPSPAGLFRFPADEAPQGYFFPTIIIDGELFTQQPLEALMSKVAAHLDIIVGGNREEDAAEPLLLEGTLPLMTAYGLRLPKGEGRSEIVQRMAWEIAGMSAVREKPPEALSAVIEPLVEAYEHERSLDVFGLGVNAHASSPEQWLLDTMTSDFSFLAAALLIAERLALPGACKRVWRYQFNGYDSRGDGFHAAELPLLLGKDDQKMLQLAGALDVRRQWIDSWSAFACKGDPNTLAMAGAWRPYTESDRPVLFWDGVRGWQADGGRTMAQRVGLFATAKLWEQLWGFDSVFEQ
mmetsp:Transcript_32324/g.89297  ORF Transcript_32324/g.89297 Transcript_32324/m.89297 type:complete len:615 (-) Transcript_32324:236-2080(-)